MPPLEEVWPARVPELRRNRASSHVGADAGSDLTGAQVGRQSRLDVGAGGDVAADVTDQPAQTRSEG
jgi:hypothetical protein